MLHYSAALKDDVVTIFNDENDDAISIRLQDVPNLIDVLSNIKPCTFDLVYSSKPLAYYYDKENDTYKKLYTSKKK